MKSPRLLFAAALIAAAGCSERFGTVPVVGRVTVTGKPPAAAGYLFFVPDHDGPPAADGSGPRSGSARWAADGSYAAGTFRAADGLRPGTYRVRIECTGGDTKAGGDAEGRPPAERPVVPAGFRPPDLVVPEGSPGPVRYDLDLPRMAGKLSAVGAGWQLARRLSRPLAPRPPLPLVRRMPA